jgi:hypothetical protein
MLVQREHRGAALVEQHTAAEAPADPSAEPPAIWDHSRDMGLGGRLMDDAQRGKIIKDSKGLDSRFSSGKAGSFL